MSLVKRLETEERERGGEERREEGEGNGRRSPRMSMIILRDAEFTRATVLVERTSFPRDYSCYLIPISRDNSRHVCGLETKKKN